PSTTIIGPCQRRAPRSTQVPGMPQRIAAGLGPHGRAVRLEPDLYLRDLTARRVETVDHVVVPARQPQPLAVGRDVAHVGAAAAWDGPFRDDLVSGEVDHRHATRPVARAVDLV